MGQSAMTNNTDLRVFDFFVQEPYSFQAVNRKIPFPFYGSENNILLMHNLFKLLMYDHQHWSMSKANSLY